MIDNSELSVRNTREKMQMLEIIGQSLLEAAAQTFVGAIAGYSFDK